MSKNDAGRMMGDHYDSDPVCQPTHWMPLPDPPEDSS